MKNKKRISLILSLTAAAAITSTAVYAAFNYTYNDAVHVKNSVLGVSEVTEKDDVNSDGIVDSLDMTAVRQELKATGETVTASYAAIEENVKIMGRTCRIDEVTWLAQSGSAVEFTVTGQSAEVTLAGDSSIEADPDYRSRYAILVDGEIITDATMNAAEETITLFSGDTTRTAKVKIIHLSEAMNGAVGVKDITITSDSPAPIVPVPKNDLCIEFIGDSITCAYGVEGASNYENFKTTTENFMKSYAYLTAEKLGADYSAVCYSGHGIVSGYTSSGDKVTDSLIPDCYDIVSKFSGYNQSWDFEASQNDVVVINLGTNDSGYVTADIENRSEEFIEGYIDFLETVREKNPQAYIICTLGTMGCTEVYDLEEQAVERYKTDTGDERVMCYFSVTQNPADGYGSDWHPSAVTQQNSAYVLSDKICQALGMESDQIGLDVAVDASYDFYTDPELGGNAYAYLNDYDKSYWINVSAGGEGPEALEALITGIGLKKNGTYRLEFDYTCAAGASVPLFLRSADDKSVIYHSDEIEPASDKTHYSAEITVDNDDPNAEIALQLGVDDNYNITLYNVKLVKTA